MIYILPVTNPEQFARINKAIASVVAPAADTPLIACTRHPTTGAVGAVLSDTRAWRIPGTPDLTTAEAEMAHTLGPDGAARWADLVRANAGGTVSLRACCPVELIDGLLDERQARALGWFPEPETPSPDALRAPQNTVS